MYLDNSTQEPLAKTLNIVLISDHLDLFQSEFETLLLNEKDDDLGRMFMLCERVYGALDQIKIIFENHIETHGKDAIQKIAATAVNVYFLIKNIFILIKKFNFKIF